MDTILSRELPEGAGPKYNRLAANIRSAIGAGELSPGDKLPPVRDLAWTLGITPGTVSRAYQLLTADGVLEAAVGRGTFVADPAVRPARKAVPLTPIGALYTPMPEEGDVYFAPRIADAGQLALIREGIARSAEAEGLLMLDYPGQHEQTTLQRAVIDWLPEDMRDTTAAEQIVMTNGGQSGLMVVQQCLVSGEAPVILTEEFSYPGVARAAEILRARVEPIPMDGEGVRADLLEEAVRRTGARVFFTMPEAHNPTCTVTSPARRQAVADVAARTGLHILQDDCFRLGPATGSSYRHLLPEQAWYVGSLSKAFSPALRTGYAVAPEGMVARLRRVVDANYHGLSSPQAIVAEHLLTHPQAPAAVEGVRATTRAHVEEALNVLGRFDLGWGHDIPFVWLRLPQGWREVRFIQALEAEGIRVRPGSDFAPRDAAAVNAVRISINGRLPVSRFRQALERIAALLDAPPERGMV